jgi:hypothetical protein
MGGRTLRAAILVAFFAAQLAAGLVIEKAERQVRPVG